MGRFQESSFVGDGCLAGWGGCGRMGWDGMVLLGGRRAGW